MRRAWQERAFQAGVLQVPTKLLARADHSRFESMLVTMAFFASIHSFHIDLILAPLARERVSIACLWHVDPKMARTEPATVPVFQVRWWVL